MPKKLTKNQRDYRQRKKEASRPSGRVPVIREDGKTTSRVARKPLCVRINEEAAAILDEAANREKRDKWEILDRMIKFGLTDGDGRSLGRDSGNTAHLDKPSAEGIKIRYKGTKGSVQINYRITVTAWDKLDRHSKAGLGQSKAKTVQDLILNYKFLSDAAREWNQEYREKNRQIREFYANRSSMVPRDGAIQTSKAWERRNGDIQLRPGLTLDHLNEQELEEYADAVHANTEMLKARIDERLKESPEIALPPMNEEALKAIRDEYMKRHGLSE